MAQLNVQQYVVGSVMTNCYVASNEETKEAVIVDPGDAADALKQKIAQSGLKPVAILLTHGHFDHASAAGELSDAYHIPVYAHEDEKETLENPNINLTGMWGEHGVSYHADVFVKDNELLSLAGFQIRVLHTPGHTVGGCCYYFEDEGAVFVGDTLFCSSVGRSDFPGGSASVLLRSIQEKLFVMPDDTNVYPGHNETTTIGWERQYNPFF